jgi:hypothetical protein
VCLDTNEHIYRKAIGKSLMDIEGLAMKEVVGEFTGKAIGTMFLLGEMHALFIKYSEYEYFVSSGSKWQLQSSGREWRL